MLKKISLTIMIVIIFPAILVLAQESEPIYLLRDDFSLISLTSNDSLSQQITSISRSMNILSEINPTYIVRAQLSQDTNQLFVLLHQGQLSVQYPFPTVTRIVVIDTTTNIYRILFERQGIFTFALSPDEKHALIGYYESDYYFSIRYTCLLNIASGNCEQIPYQISSDPGQWVDNETYILITQARVGLRLMNITDNEGISLPLPEGWSFNAATPIPRTRSVLIGAGNRDLSKPPVFGFFTLNIDTYALEALPYAESRTISRWSFSPNSEYILYGEPNPTVVEFNTGRIVYEFTSAINWGWRDAHTLVIQGILDGDHEVSISQINVLDGTVISLARGNNAEGILIIP